MNNSEKTEQLRKDFDKKFLSYGIHRLSDPDLVRYALELEKQLNNLTK